LPNGVEVSEEGTYVSELLTGLGCDSIITTELTVNPVITTQVSASICEGATYLLPDGSSVSEAGIYNTLLTSVNNCDSLVITSLSLHSGYTSEEFIEICEGSSYVLPSGISASAEGDYLSALTSVEGCDSVITTHLSFIEISLPVVSASGPLTFCAGGSVTLTSTPAASYQWTKNGNTIPGATNQSYVANKSGNYKVIVPTACGDRTSLPTIVVKNNPPVVSIAPAGTVTICANDNLLLTATVAGNVSVTYQWYRNNILISGATDPTYLVTQSGRYKVKVTDTQTGCEKMSSKVEVIRQSFNAVITPDKSLVTCKEDIVLTLATNAGAGATYQWKKNGVAIQGATGLTFTTCEPGTYKVLVTNANGCTRHSNALTIIEDCDKKEDVRLFNIFPNPVKGKVFIEKEYQGDVVVKCQVLDIAGKVVLESESLKSNGGLFHLEMETHSLTPGIYFMKINENGKIYSQKIIVQ